MSEPTYRDLIAPRVAAAVESLRQQGWSEDAVQRYLAIVDRLAELVEQRRQRKRESRRTKRKKQGAGAEDSPSARAKPKRTTSRRATRREVSMREYAILMSEEQLYELVREAALFAGWRIYHTYDSRRSYAGFPDIVLVRPPRLVFVELKREKGQLTEEQQQWLADLAACGCEVHVWRPSDWWSNAILAALGYGTDAGASDHRPTDALGA